MTIRRLGPMTLPSSRLPTMIPPSVIPPGPVTLDAMVGLGLNTPWIIVGQGVLSRCSLGGCSYFFSFDFIRGRLILPGRLVISPSSAPCRPGMGCRRPRQWCRRTLVCLQNSTQSLFGSRVDFHLTSDILTHTFSTFPSSLLEVLGKVVCHLGQLR